MSGLHIALEQISKRSGDIYAVELDGIEIIFSLPSIKAAEQYQRLISFSTSSADVSTIYEKIFRDVVRDDWLSDHANDIKAGIPETIAKLVLKLSGLDETSVEYTEELFSFFRSQADATITYMKRIICMTFGGYTFQSLDMLDYQSLVNVFVQAEKALLNRGIIEQEHDFSAPQEAKEPVYKIDELIKQDNEAFRELNNSDPDDPRKLAYMQKIREGAKRRAEEEERKYRNQ